MPRSLAAAAAMLLLMSAPALAQPNAAKPPTTNNDVAKGGTAYSMGANQYGVGAPLSGEKRHARDLKAKEAGPHPRTVPADQGKPKNDQHGGKLAPQ